MGIDPKQLLIYIIQPALIAIGKYDRNSAALLLGTAAAESNMGHYIHQLNNGPAIGIYQMEPNTFEDIWNNYLKYRLSLVLKIKNYCRIQELRTNDMIQHLGFATMMSRIHYLRIAESIPIYKDPLKMGNYWKTYYNTPNGKGTIGHFCEQYENFNIEKIINDSF